MLADYRVQVSLGMYNDPDQHASNTWYFRGISSGQSEGVDVTFITTALSTFYAAIDSTLPSAVFDGRTELLFYRMADPEPRVPIAQGTLAGFTPAAGANLFPSDVAVCLSYRADYVSGDARGRKRGRMYFGPLLASTGTLVTDEGMRVAAGTRTTYTNAAAGINTSLAGSSVQWRMYSPTNGDFPFLVEASMNDQFDTRRSRDKPGFVTTTVTL